MNYEKKYRKKYDKFNNKYTYLSKVNSLWDLASPYYLEVNDYDYTYLSKILNIQINNKCDFKILELDNSLIKKIDTKPLKYLKKETVKNLQERNIKYKMV